MTRKLTAVLLALAQLAFGIFLTASGGKAEKERIKDVNEIIENGEEFLFDVYSFTYDPEEAQPVSFSLYDFNWDYNYRYYPLTADESGVAHFGESTVTPPQEGPYLNIYSEFYYRLNAAKMRELFGREWNYFGRGLFSQNKNRFNVLGKWQPVYAVGRVYNGEIVFIGMKIGDTRY